MSLRKLVITAALAGGAVLALAMSPASAFTLASPSLAAPVASAQVDKVWYDNGYGYSYHHCWRDSYGYRHCN